MEKFEIKSIGAIMTMMILSSFVAAESTDNIICNIKCENKCAEYLSPKYYAQCMKDCKSHCDKSLSDPVYNCITGCHLMKSIAIKDGAGDFGNDLVNTCMQECKTSF
ncbi:hypothetical protein V8G54_024424 [Vigna mungo]|uniref:Thionin-like protein n=1 Tax=Vigna mungo TaxID=3915 RepID=A0AAQ3RSJ6_VIGMU